MQTDGDIDGATAVVAQGLDTYSNEPRLQQLQATLLRAQVEKQRQAVHPREAREPRTAAPAPEASPTPEIPPASPARDLTVLLGSPVAATAVPLPPAVAETKTPAPAPPSAPTRNVLETPAPPPQPSVAPPYPPTHPPPPPYGPTALDKLNLWFHNAGREKRL